MDQISQGKGNFFPNHFCPQKSDGLYFIFSQGGHEKNQNKDKIFSVRELLAT